ncbi:D-alanine--D-alanine ligase [Candidatus Desantisbacteria bacterium CG1_02_38_46]|uniref:D-alanine--D-alanine ligase n=3 Tax=unclassified Candidatus Desantisiibacteriota TaxID=3106372 RepID=A0A2H9PBQ9_9BACT|nr:MAG: D-alanine--D-alanine ligase [Candidatus Desantisbacteria bacterium CG1_02_38_46]PIU51382.1 MAG: D-alanine--D-alanine ligase [Candidatus Desantisbacteria bacterium CG07_land_8_20_14_0_80_39_15]PIZ15409.1 MAG: D-alanine--D-alanine ligase [Candidatus Desantisbacteria bacterium CG_4_10_14_0_8_um_filter_39_17]
MKTKGLRIIVLKGGWSSEREISLKSGAAVEKALKDGGFKVSSFDIKGRKSLAEMMRKKFDVVFIVLHGKFGEDGGIQAFLEGMNIPYTGSGVLASALAMNKILSKKIFQAEGIPTPDYHIVRRSTFALRRSRLILPFPVVVKPSCEGSTIGVSIVENKKELRSGMRLAFKYDNEILIEKYIAGAEITVSILDEQPLPVIELRPKRKFYDYQAKYKVGMCEHIVPAPLPKEIYKEAQELALRAHRVLGCRDYSRVDMRVGKKGIYVLEVNTVPGMSKLSLVPEAARAAGIEFSELVRRLIDLALKH